MSNPALLPHHRIAQRDSRRAGARALERVVGVIGLLGRPITTIVARTASRFLIVKAGVPH